MIKLCKQNKISVLEKVRNGQLDAVALSVSNLADDIVLAMHKNGVLSCFKKAITDKRRPNAVIPFELVLALAITAKMKVKTALTDIPFAIQDHRVLAELGFNIIDTGGIEKGIMTEGSLRHLFGKYEYQEFFTFYNEAVQKYIMPEQNLVPNIHILDCTKIEVEYSNFNYEESKVARDSNGNNARGYKLSTLRGVIDDTGIIEDIRFGAMNIHDLALSEDMLRTSPVLKPGDILINDRGFLSRDVVNFLKTNRGVDTYVPLKCNMPSFKLAVQVANEENKWFTHPNKKRESQKIAFVSDLGAHWQSDNPKDDVDFNACIVWDTKADKPENEYRVFITTDLSKSAIQIIKTYELRPEIEEDYRQIKDFWKLEDFKSTKIHLISFHIMCVLFGYLFFQLYTMLPEGEQYAHKSLPVILKNYSPKNLGYLVFYAGGDFGIFSLVEFGKLYASCGDEIKLIISDVMESI